MSGCDGGCSGMLVVMEWDWIVLAGEAVSYGCLIISINFHDVCSHIEKIKPYFLPGSTQLKLSCTLCSQGKVHGIHPTEKKRVTLLCTEWQGLSVSTKTHSFHNLHERL